MLISYCCSAEKVCLHLFSWPCLQWMSSSFAYLTNVPSYECTITCWCFRWKERFSGLWKCPIYTVAIFVIFPKGLTHCLSWKIEIWHLFSSPDFFWGRGDVCKQAKPKVTLTTQLPVHQLHWLHCQDYLTIYITTVTTLTTFTTLTLLTISISFTALHDYYTTPTTLAKIIINFGSPIQFSNTMRLIKLYLLIWLITPTTASTL